MSDAASDTVAASEQPRHSDGSPSGADAPDERGRLSIDRSVLRRIAEHTADTSPNCVPYRAGSALGRSQHGTQARLHGPDEELRVRLELGVRYPNSVTDSVHDISERVSSELHRLAGCRVRSVDVVVAALVPDPQPPRVE